MCDIDIKPEVLEKQDEIERLRMGDYDAETKANFEGWTEALDWVLNLLPS